MDGMEESAAIRTNKEKHKTFKQAAEDHGIVLARSALERVADEHQDHTPRLWTGTTGHNVPPNLRLRI